MNKHHDHVILGKILQPARCENLSQCQTIAIIALDLRYQDSQRILASTYNEAVTYIQGLVGSEFFDNNIQQG